MSNMIRINYNITNKTNDGIRASGRNISTITIDESNVVDEYIHSN